MSFNAKTPSKTKENPQNEIHNTKKKSRKETTKAQRAKLITLREVELTYAKISEQTGVPKTTCFDIVTRDLERQKEGELTPYTASARRSGRSENLIHWEKQHLISIAKCERLINLGILTPSITTKVCIKIARKILNDEGYRNCWTKRKTIHLSTEKA